VPKEPFESAVQLTKDGIVEGRICVRQTMSRTLVGNDVLAFPEAITDENVDGLIPFRRE
jgi:hypothetical protein